jgi:hypothetical protein
MRYLMLACALLLSACKTIKVDKGEVPDEYRAMAQAYMGTYAGSFNGGSGTLTLALVGRKVVLSYKDASGTSSDILDARCDSRFGNLETVTVSKDKAASTGGKTAYKLDSATIAFDPNRCWGSVDGREIALDFSKKNGHTRLDASMIYRQEYERQCRIDPGNPRAGVPPHEYCDEVPVTRYLTGRFQR